MSLIWGLSFAKMLSSIFPLENASQIGFSIPDVTAPLSYQRQRSPKRANESERAINPGSRGKAPALFLPISREKWGPPPGRRGNGALRPKGASEPPTPRVRTTVMPLVWLAGFEFRSLLTRLKDAGTFCVPWLHGNLSQRVYKRQFHKYHSFFLTILLLFATINMKILSLENVK